MDDREIFNHLLAMSLKISADRRLKAKKKKKLKTKTDIKFSIDRLLESYPIFECRMCHNKFNLKSEYYTHDCPNWKCNINYETEEKMPVFKIPKVPEAVPLTVENFKSQKLKKTEKKIHKNSKAYKNSISNLQVPSKSTKLFELLTEGVKKRRKVESTPSKSSQLSFSIDKILGLDQCKK